MGPPEDLDQSWKNDEMEVQEDCASSSSELLEEDEVEDPSLIPVKVEEVEGSDTVKFSPPVYIQRYCKVNDVIRTMLQSPKYKDLNQETGKTVMEVGCAEFGMMKYFKNHLDVGKLIFLDLDKDLLEQKQHVLKPLPAEYLQRTSRPQALQVQAYAGCITTVDADLQRENPGIWAVVGIEIIEHLHADVLRGFEETVFGILSPNLVIVTTPNAEFNEVFALPPGKFRHWDHKFEWTRQEFCQWCEKIVGEFKSYSYKIEGICEGSEETRHLGCVSQMAIFEKLGVGKSTEPLFSHRIRKDAYTLIQSLEYPNYKETRTLEEITICEFNFYVSNYVLSTSMRSQYEDSGMSEVKLPLTFLQSIPAMPEVPSKDMLFLRNVLEKNGSQIGEEEGQIFVIISLEDQDSDSSMDDEEYLCEDLVDLNVNKVVDTVAVEDNDDNWY